MARIYRKQFINPLPSNVDKTWLSAYMTGITDGEGSFILLTKEQARLRAKCKFTVRQRTDNCQILFLMQSFFGCGRIHHMSAIALETERKRYQCSPTSEYNVSTIEHLAKIIVPHFENHPLQGRKQEDFDIWKQGVALAYHVNISPEVSARGIKGFRTRWTEKRLDKFSEISANLRKQRLYESAGIPLPEPIPESLPYPTLFDC